MLQMILTGIFSILASIRHLPKLIHDLRSEHPILLSPGFIKIFLLVIIALLVFYFINKFIQQKKTIS